MKIFERKLFHKIQSQLYEREYIIIVGARQTGKSTILKQIADLLKNNKESYIELTLEDFSVLNQLNEHPENIFLYTSKPKNDEKKFVLIDEIQYLQNPTNFLKLLFDKYSENLKIIATGSSAFYIDNKFKDSLAGRKKLYELHTLDFEEFLYFKTESNQLSDELNLIRKNENYLSIHRKEISAYFEDFLTFGSYPAVVVEEDKEIKVAKLKELLNSFVKRDIDDAKVQFPDKFYFLMKILAEQTGNLLNVNELSSTLGLSTTTVNHYIYVLQKCFHISLLKPFYKNIRKELTKMPKIYFNDLGMRNILLNQFGKIEYRLDKGSLLENFLFIRLNELYDSDYVRFWRTTNQNEIDFVVSEDYQSGFAIECKFRSTNFKINNYKSFVDNYPNYKLHCRTYDDKSNNEWILGI